MKKHIRNLSLSLTCLLPLAAYGSTSVPYIIDGTIKAGNNRNYAQGAVFAPLVTNDDDLIFGDIRYMHHLPKTGKKKNSLYDPKSYEANFGLGYRKALDDSTVLGAAAYYDIRNAQISKALFSQVTLNTHFLTPTWQAHANLYIPAGKKKVTKTISKFSGKGKVLDRDIFFTYDNNTLVEKSLPGFDLRLSRSIPNYENVRIGSIFYYFKDKKAISGAGIDLSWVMNENIKFEANYTYDKVRKNNIVAGVRFSLPLGNTGNGRIIDKLLATRVERDLDIVTNKATDNTKKNVYQANMLAIRKNDLMDINASGEAKKNIVILNKLQAIHDQKGVLVLAEDGEEFDFNIINKIGGDDLAKEVTNHQNLAQNSINNNNQQIANIITTAAANANPLSRQLAVLGAQKANQITTQSSGLFVGGQMKFSVQNDLNLLFAKYATTNATGNKVLNINLPGYPNALIERAGSMLLVKENGVVCAIVATDENSTIRNQNTGRLPLNIWFGGKVDQGDKSVAETVMRESFEESAGSVYISQRDFDTAIQDGRFFYSPNHKNLTIVHPDTLGLYDIAEFTKSLNALKLNPAIAHSMKEVVSYHMVPVNQMVTLYNNMQNPPRLPNGQHDYHNQAYQVTDINGNALRIDGYYARAFGATPNGLAALNKAANKL